MFIMFIDYIYVECFLNFIMIFVLLYLLIKNEFDMWYWRKEVVYFFYFVLKKRVEVKCFFLVFCIEDKIYVMKKYFFRFRIIDKLYIIFVVVVLLF